MVVTFHEKVTGSNTSVVASLKNWLHALYDMRDYTSKLKGGCRKNIKEYMITDINQAKYQDEPTDDGANAVMRSDMEEKYDWLDWVRLL